MANHARRTRALEILSAGGPATARILILALLVAPSFAGPARAAGADWTVEVEPLYMSVQGHDQHVLTVHEIDRSASPPLDEKRAVELDTDDGPAYRGRLEYDRGTWAWGLDFFWFTTSQDTADRSASADGPAGPLDEVVFEVADRSYSSTGPGEVLYFRRLEDTDVAVWTADLYAARTLAEGAGSELRLLLGLRVGDFDNDYRAVVGVEGVGGSRLDASSNYDRMTGPLVGLGATLERGRSSLRGTFVQSVLFGSAELTSFQREFVGPFGETPAFVGQEVFRADEDVAIPITELRLRWIYRLTDHLFLGAGFETSAWWDVSVPPGVVPGPGGDQVLHENTLVFSGGSVSLGVAF